MVFGREKGVAQGCARGGGLRAPEEGSCWLTEGVLTALWCTSRRGALLLLC